jgi:bifunctional DNA-binding transcriptional regulator/antitoxin component of YhaV-PrlF toxin-antitoxin module
MGSNYGKSVGLTFGDSASMSQALVKLQRRGQMVIPRLLREEAGIAEGTLMKVAVIEGGQFLVTPQLTIARSVIADRKGHGRNEALRKLGQVVAELRQEAKEKGLNNMPKREINAAVTAARKDLRKSGKRPVK